MAEAFSLADPQIAALDPWFGEILRAQQASLQGVTELLRKRWEGVRGTGLRILADLIASGEPRHVETARGQSYLGLYVPHTVVDRDGKVEGHDFWCFIPPPIAPDDVRTAMKKLGLEGIPGLTDFYIHFNGLIRSARGFIDCRRLEYLSSYMYHEPGQQVFPPIPAYRPEHFRGIFERALARERFGPTPVGTIDRHDWLALYATNADLIIMKPDGHLAWLQSMDKAYLLDLSWEEFIEKFSRIIPADAEEFLYFLVLGLA